MPRRSTRAAAPMLSAITSPLLTTKEAATALNYSMHTLRRWATTGEGPIQPHRVGVGLHLRWRTNDVRALAGLPPLAETAAEGEAARTEEAAREARDRDLRAQLSTLRQACARIEALVGAPAQLELPA